MKRGIIIGLIFCLLFMPFLYSNSEEVCEDGTEWFSCSENQPFYCVKDMYQDESESVLRSYCFECGCPGDEICQEDGSCKSPSESQNRAPYADAGLDKMVYQGESFGLNGFDSWDKDYWQQLNYNWEDSKEENIDDGITPDVVFNQDGVHEIKLTVSDGDLIDEDEIIIGVAERDVWWNEDWKKRVPIVLENKNEAKEYLPVFVRLEDVFGKHYDFTDEIVKSIRVVNDGGELNYVIFDWDKIDGVTPYDFLVFMTNFNSNEAKTIYVYYDNDNAEQINYIDFENDIISNQNNLVNNPSFENVCEIEGTDQPCNWELWAEDDETTWYNEEGVSCDESFVGSCSFELKKNIPECGNPEHLHGLYQSVEINGATPYMMGSFVKSNAIVFSQEFSPLTFSVLFQNADNSFIHDNDGYDGGLFEQADIYRANFNYYSVAMSHDWNFYLTEFVSPFDEYEVLISLWGKEVGNFLYDGLFFIEQPKIVVGEIENSLGYIGKESNSFFIYNTVEIFQDDNIEQLKKYQINDIEIAKKEFEIVPLIFNSNINLEDVEIEIDAPNGIETTIYRAHYVDTSLRTIQTYNEKSWADALPTYQKRDLAKDENHVFWVKFYAKENAHSGIQNIEVKIKSSNARSESINLGLRIRDFELPDKTELMSFGQYFFGLERYNLFEELVNSELLSWYRYDKVGNYMDLMSDYGIYFQEDSKESCYDDRTNELHINFEGNNYAKKMEYKLLELNQNSVEIFRGFLPGNGEGLDSFEWIKDCNNEDNFFIFAPFSEEFKITLHTQLKETANFLKSIEPTTTIIYKIGGETWGRFNDDSLYGAYLESEETFLDLISDIRDDLFLISDTYIPHEFCSGIKEHQKRFDVLGIDRGFLTLIGKEGIKNYQEEGFDFVLNLETEFAVDSQKRSNMVASWISWDWGFKGFHSERWPPFLRNYLGGSTWDDPMTLYMFRLAGDMTYFYDGIDTDYNVPTEDLTPVPSLRMELFREGYEDYKKFELLNNLIEKAEQQEINTINAETALARVTEAIDPETYEFVDNPALIYEIRSQVNQEIENLLNQMPEERKEPEKEKCSVSKCDPGCLNPVIIFEDGCEKCICKESLKKFSWGFFGRISLIFWIVLVFVIVGMVTYFILRKRKLSQIREYQELS